MVLYIIHRISTLEWERLNKEMALEMNTLFEASSEDKVDYYTAVSCRLVNASTNRGIGYPALISNLGPVPGILPRLWPQIFGSFTNYSNIWLSAFTFSSTSSLG